MLSRREPERMLVYHCYQVFAGAQFDAFEKSVELGKKHDSEQ